MTWSKLTPDYSTDSLELIPHGDITRGLTPLYRQTILVLAAQKCCAADFALLV
jgi:hypothetical protein